jgi:hypothetical protein
MLQKRAAMMQQWATFLVTNQGGMVVAIGSRRA